MDVACVSQVFLGDLAALREQFLCASGWPTCLLNLCAPIATVGKSAEACQNPQRNHAGDSHLW